MSTSTRVPCRRRPRSKSHASHRAQKSSRPRAENITSTETLTGPLLRYASKFSGVADAYKIDGVKHSAAKVSRRSSPSLSRWQPAGDHTRSKKKHGIDAPRPLPQDYHNVTTLPTLIAFKDGKEVKRATNEAERKELAATLGA